MMHQTPMWCLNGPKSCSCEGTFMVNKLQMLPRVLFSHIGPLIVWPFSPERGSEACLCFSWKNSHFLRVQQSKLDLCALGVSGPLKGFGRIHPGLLWASLLPFYLSIYTVGYFSCCILTAVSFTALFLFCCTLGAVLCFMTCIYAL